MVPAQSSFEISYATEKDEYFNDGMVDQQGNIILTGQIGNYTLLDHDGIIMKIYPDGSYIVRRIEHQDTIGGFSSVTLLNNGNYFVTGSMSLTGEPYYNDHLSITIFDTALHIISEKTFLINSQYTFLGVNAQSILDNDGNIAIAGMACRDENGTMLGDFCFFKLTQDGDTLLSRYYHTWYEAEPYTLRKMPGSDNLMLISNGLIPFTAGELVFLDKDLNILNYNRLFTLGGGAFCSDVWLNNQEFLMTENRIDHSGAINEYYFGVHRLDTSAQYYNELILDNKDTIEYMAVRKSMAYSDDTTIYISGYQTYNILWTTLPTGIFLYIIDRELNLRGHLVLGGDANYASWGTLATPDKGCLIYGTRYDNTTGWPERDIHIWKVLREDIFLYTSVEKHPESEPGVYPNPVSDVLNITLDGRCSGQTVRFRIYNTLGARFLDRQLHLDGNQIRTQTCNLPSGVYLYELVDENGEKFSGKFIKE
ncbi:MAG: hypothetical protein A2X11_09575 [Bacteroidetes bacterium GWE2_42_24]|nr:MAG: hypothetical protein A2X11_09575 [Bacteroidetes bacterium GWE2_42_24]OFY25744.1 MAG: hypothetical protein A2X09_09180 [Bacteroidetes bacterium GWF2_43_11]